MAECVQRALWQEKLRALQSALEICEKSGLPQTKSRRQNVLFEVGGIRRRFGQHKEGICTLQEALYANEDPDPLKRAQILGELGVLYRHVNQYDLARSTFKQQYLIASQRGIDGEAEMCRALGNEGMAVYNIYQSTMPARPELLREAFDKLEARVLRAQKLQDRLSRDDPHSPFVSLSLIWQKIGMDRLTLCYIAAGKASEAVLQAEASQRLQTGEEPTVTGYSRFFYGNALWHNGQPEKARHVWSAPVGVCGSVHSIRKEPTNETVGYLSLLASAGVDFDTYDEQGFSPLDYAVLSDSDDARRMVDIVLNALRTSIRPGLELGARQSQGNATGNVRETFDEIVTAQVEEEVSVRLRLANVRRY
ncbi:hypothetical protein CBER1_04531 [Cercospora berteroae]|uniref:Uncharacterized protein n=1 Tax=Cercospora berteroae TaxID=357750 RepID=A0A2S6CF32_9PEZI|nr:hypothetical protein CBER1_04531 [Cercospora berteroae]